MKTHLIIDSGNLLFRIGAANLRYNEGTPDQLASLALHMSLLSMLKHFKRHKPDQIAVTFEGSQNWRKDFTRSEECISKRLYKGNRVKSDAMIPIFELIRSFEDLARKHTSLICLSNPRLEGDDIFAGYVSRFCEAGDEVIGISGDKDFAQLLKYKNFTLINPDGDQPRTLESVCGVNDPRYFMFEKAMRGDKGDNVFPAYPRVLKTRLKKCLEDDYERTKIMNETWTFTDPESKQETVYRVGDLFEENMKLLSLEHQPDEIKKIINETLDHELVSTGHWNFFSFLKFCGKYKLDKIADSAAQFAEMFSLKQE